MSRYLARKTLAEHDLTDQTIFLWGGEMDNLNHREAGTDIVQRPFSKRDQLAAAG
jgi:hypothetical protein